MLKRHFRGRGGRSCEKRIPVGWTAYEARRFNIEMPDKVPMVTQERAYTSPIWYIL